jgi:hypothetical protein
MTTDSDKLLSPDTPLVFADGTSVYRELAQTYVTHETGYYILAPSGAGKTYFVESQQEKHWIDGDVLWAATHAHPAGEWWHGPVSEIQEIARRSDVITVQAKRLGFWIVGVDDFAITPDAIVIPNWNTHQRYIRARETTNYTGGATSDERQRVLTARRWISRHAKNGVPRFASVAEAASFLATKSPA